MFDLKAPIAYSKLEEAIDELLKRVLETECDSDTYANLVDQLNKLYKAKEIDSKIKVSEFEAVQKANEAEAKLKLTDLELGLQKVKHDSEAELRSAETEAKIVETTDRRRVKPDTLALVGANILGIVLVIGHERASVIATKALGFVSKALK